MKKLKFSLFAICLAMLFIVGNASVQGQSKIQLWPSEIVIKFLDVKGVQQVVRHGCPSSSGTWGINLTADYIAAFGSNYTIELVCPYGMGGTIQWSKNSVGTSKFGSVYADKFDNRTQLVTCRATVTNYGVTSTYTVTFRANKGSSISINKEAEEVADQIQPRIQAWPTKTIVTALGTDYNEYNISRNFPTMAVNAEIDLSNNFQAMPGSRFSLELQCFMFTGKVQWYVLMSGVKIKLEGQTTLKYTGSFDSDSQNYNITYLAEVSAYGSVATYKYIFRVGNKLMMMSEVEENDEIMENDSQKQDENNFDINVYPNPTTQILKVDIISNNIDDNADFKISLINNNNGVIVNSYNTKDLNSQMDVSSFQDGFYILKLENGHNIVTKQVIIKH